MTDKLSADHKPELLKELLEQAKREVERWPESMKNQEPSGAAPSAATPAHQKLTDEKSDCNPITDVGAPSWAETLNQIALKLADKFGSAANNEIARLDWLRSYIPAAPPISAEQFFHEQPWVRGSPDYTYTLNGNEIVELLEVYASRVLAAKDEELAHLRAEHTLYALLRGVCENVIDWLATLSYDAVKHQDVLTHPLTIEIRHQLDAMYKHPLDDKLLLTSDQVENKLAEVERLKKELADQQMQINNYRSVYDGSPNDALNWKTRMESALQEIRAKQEGK